MAEKDSIQSYLDKMDLSQVPPDGSPPALKSIPATEEELKDIGWIRARSHYGGEGEKSHLGGFTTVDPFGLSPRVWRDMMEYFGVKSVLDIGCGRGVSTSWFLMQGVKVQCVEGSPDGINRSLLPGLANEYAPNYSQDLIVEHDFSLGPWWPEKTVDAVWCVEFLEHVSRHFQPNYLAAMKKAAIIFASHASWGGWHHTEIHDNSWWITKFEMHGFKYSEELTNRIHKIAEQERDENIALPYDLPKSEKTYRAIHIFRRMQVFINPAVAARSEHRHLLSEPGCLNDKTQESIECGKEPNRHTRLVNTKLPDRFLFIPYKEDQHKKWEEYLAKSVAEDLEKQNEKS